MEIVLVFLYSFYKRICSYHKNLLYAKTFNLQSSFKRCNFLSRARPTKTVPDYLVTFYVTCAVCKHFVWCLEERNKAKKAIFRLPGASPWRRSKMDEIGWNGGRAAQGSDNVVCALFSISARGGHGTLCARMTLIWLADWYKLSCLWGVFLHNWVFLWFLFSPSAFCSN